MSTKIIGINICNLRKKTGITQEELAKSVGVSTQAVSKWECGGAPDTELLPIIADYFNISIDRLFGRSINEYSDLKTEIAKHISSIQQEERMYEAMEYCWVIEKALGGTNVIERSLKQEFEINQNNYCHSQMQFENGFSSFSLSKEMPYFIIMPEPENGWSNGFFSNDKYVNIYKLLGDPEILNCLIMLYKRENKPFTPKLLENRLKLSNERAKQILESLKLYGLISETEIELDDSIQKVYNFNPNPAFIALLAITKEIIKRPNAFTHLCSYRNKTYL